MKGIFERKDHFGLKAMHICGFQGFSPMFHPHGELIYLAGGVLSVTVDGEALLLKEGDVAVIFPYLVHSYEASEDADVILVLFDPAETAFDNVFLRTKPVTARASGRFLAPLLERVLYHTRGGRTKTAMGYCNAVLGEFLELVPTKASDRHSEQGAVRVLEYLSEHYTDPLTVKSVSDALYVSPSYISKLFSQELKYGFREYLNSLRIQKAVSLLENTDKKIVDVMLDCGFQNQSSFNRIFRDSLGSSPADYRSRFKGEKREE